MTEAARAAPGGGQFRHFLPEGADIGLKNQLGHALTARKAAFLPGGVQQHHQNLPGIVRVYDAHALGHGKPVARAQAAAGIDKARQARLLRLHADACGHAQPGARRDARLGRVQAGPQIETGGKGRGRGQKVFPLPRVKLTRAGTDKGDMHRSADRSRVRRLAGKNGFACGHHAQSCSAGSRRGQVRGGAAASYLSSEGGGVKSKEDGKHAAYR